MGQMYTALFDAVAVTAAQDFFTILGVADRVTVIHAWEIGQSSDVGDAAEEGLVIQTKRGTGSVTAGSGGTTPTPPPIDAAGAAFGGTVHANDTTKLLVGSGVLTQLEACVWNVRVPYEKIYTPETRPILQGAQRFAVTLEAAPADSLTVSGTIKFEVI